MRPSFTPYKTSSKTTVSYILIYVFRQQLEDKILN
jgi:hypothetical protein